MLERSLRVQVFAAAMLLAPVGDREDALEVGRMFLERGDYRGAILHLEPLAERAPDDVDLALQLGMAYFACDRFEEARGPFQTVTRLAPGDGLPWEFLGRVEYRLGRLDLAAACLERAAGLDARDGRTFNHLGAVLSRLGRRAEAREAFLNALRIDPSFGTAHYNLGMILALDGDSLAGARHLREAARLDPGDDDAAEALGDLFTREGDEEGALEWYREAVRRAPDDLGHRLVLARTLERRGDVLSAEVQLVRACELAPDSSAPFMRWAEFLARRARVTEAIAAYRRALERDDASVEAHLGLADLAEDAGEDLLARRHLEAAIELGARHPDLLRRLSRACERLSDEAGARAAFERLVVEGDGGEASLRAIAECLATSRLDAVRDVARAQALAAALVRRSGERSAAALFVLSRAQEAAGDAAAAARSLERAAALFHAQGPEASLLRRLSEQARAGR